MDTPSPSGPPQSFSQLLGLLSPEKFLEMLAASTRASREEYFARHKIRLPQTPRLISSAQKQAERTRLLHARLVETEDDSAAQMVLRRWLLKRRPLLIQALDYLKIPHEDGITSNDIGTQFTALSTAEKQNLQQHLEQGNPAEDVMVYLHFLELSREDAPDDPESDA